MFILWLHLFIFYAIVINISLKRGLLKDIDEKIFLSPFKNSFIQDINIISEIRTHIEDYYHIDNLTRYIINKCDNLRKYVVSSDGKKKDEINNLFLELLR